MGRQIRSAESLRLLAVALDCGITHFDTARSYGYGEAEAVVGRFARGRRDQVTIATKLGIVPPSRTLMGLAKAVARPIVKLAPGLRRRLTQSAGAMLTFGAFDVKTARASLETSLRTLRSDYVDLLLLHECRPEDLNSDDLLSFLEEAVKAGRVRQYGVATGVDATQAILATHWRYAPVVQVPYAFERLSLGARTPGVILHSVVHALPELLRIANEDPSFALAIARILDRAPLDEPSLCHALLQAAMQSYSGGIVLFSSVKPQRIRDNVAAVSAAPFHAPRLESLLELVRSRLPNGD